MLYSQCNRGVKHLQNLSASRRVPRIKQLLHNEVSLYLVWVLLIGKDLIGCDFGMEHAVKVQVPGENDA